MDERTEELAVDGLHCASCADELEQAVSRLHGVTEARAHFASGTLRVRYSTSQLDHALLVEHVERIGYTARHAHQEDAKSLWRRREAVFTGISGALLALGLALSVFGLDPTLTVLLGRALSLSTVLYLSSVLFGAYHFARRSLYALRTFSLGINSLMSLAIIGAIIIGEYVEAASLAFLFALAELLEEFSVARARRSLRELIKLAPSEARVRRNGQELMLPLEQIEPSEIIAVRPGERIALDGQVLTGSSAVNQAPITGESVPVEKQPGDAVFAGTINQEGYLEIKVTKRVKDTTLAKIIHLVEEAEAQKAPSEKFVDRFARYYTPGVVAVAVGVATIPPIFAGAPLVDWFTRALALLVIACPCALLISTPVSIISAITSAARHGVLIKGGIYLEELGQIKTIVFDKTGTLTTGQLAVTDVIALDGSSSEEVLRIAAALENKSQHPIARAIVRYYTESAPGESLLEARDFVSLTGRGVQARLDGRLYMVGKPELFTCPPPSPFKREGEGWGEGQGEVGREIWKHLARLESQAKTVVGVGTPERLLGLIAVADQLRSEAAKTVQRLEHLGLKVVMITGDNEGTARAVAQQLGIAHYRAGVLPDGKVTEIQKLLREHGKVAMVGDGVNDAPALATSTVGIAMGAMGTDAALETAHVALMADDLSKLPYLISLGRRARRVIQQNVWFSILTKFSLGAGVLPGYVTLVLAVLVGDMGASLAVTGNALRLAHIRPSESK
ncbi:cadmium-translocating P-type ATPase [Candidatus Acetothermia bacterium]|jgi:Cd2+/Zn2+-exporting ATPase|nr:cadmium-translocating P-type ATPase [Candidatus Acetothermia bacterium]MCI2432697.1 cadmium-translocating P-type ATPase [Candidatus Acetothermia bacterium]MCI2436085.1 cadmium-translocating P-type ATPase [Candidatus Acetothermia bacterium]